jgi:hypothetical protein
MSKRKPSNVFATVVCVGARSGIGVGGWQAYSR